MAIRPNTVSSHGSGRRPRKIVFSRTLTGAPTRIARVEREFYPEQTRKFKRESEHDIFIGGAELAGLALESDLVDECHLFLNPVIVGGRKPAFRVASGSKSRSTRAMRVGAPVSVREKTIFSAFCQTRAKSRCSGG